MIFLIIFVPYNFDSMKKNISNPFVYGKAVEGDNFTDREFETSRLRLNFENGVNSILISPRRMGKTSLVKKAISQMTSPDIKIVFMDIYKCRTAMDFYEKFASSVIRSTSSKIDKMLELAKNLLVGITPQIRYSPEPNSDFSLSLGLSPQTTEPEEVLNLPEVIAVRQDVRIVVCIDEFQQIGEMPDSLSLQKIIRSVWQHQQHVSYCLFGSKRHLMTNLFYKRSMPFYQFGDMFFLKRIPTDKWVPFIISRFTEAGKRISADYAKKICEKVENYSSYVQQLAWNVLAVTPEEVTEESFLQGVESTLEQVTPLFVEQSARLTTYQLNLLRAICEGVHRDYGNTENRMRFNLGSRSNIDKLKSALVEREIIEVNEDGVFIADPLFSIWFKREMM